MRWWRQWLARTRAVWKLPALEGSLVRVTGGRSRDGIVSKLAPRWSSYEIGQTVRRVRRHDVTLELDLSELVEWYAYWGFRDPSLDAALALCTRGMTVLDVGAHVGIFTLAFARMVGPEGEVHAVEPDATNYRKLLRHLELNPDITWVTVHHTAVSDRRRILQLETPNPHNRTPRVAAEGVTVQAIPLDDLGIEPNLIKMDIEGHEPYALAGARRTLARRPLLFLEVGDKPLAYAGSSTEQILEQLRRYGYRVTDRRTARAPVIPIGLTDVICRPA
jgi:FkbM family methyltransferase